MDTDTRGVSDPRGCGGVDPTPQAGGRSRPVLLRLILVVTTGAAQNAARVSGAAVSRDARPANTVWTGSGRTAHERATTGRHCQAVSPEGLRPRAPGVPPSRSPCSTPGFESAVRRPGGRGGRTGVARRGIPVEEASRRARSQDGLQLSRQTRPARWRQPGGRLARARGGSSTPGGLPGGRGGAGETVRKIVNGGACRRETKTARPEASMPIGRASGSSLRSASRSPACALWGRLFDGHASSLA